MKDQGKKVPQQKQARRNSKTKGFTLIELLVVIAILAILMGIGVGVGVMVNEKAAQAGTKGVIAQLETALTAYNAKHGFYIQARNNVFYLDQPLDGADDFTDHIDYELMKKKSCDSVDIGGTTWYYVVDAYANAIIYKCPGKKNRTQFDLVSMGADGKSSQNGDAATYDADDIANY